METEAADIDEVLKESEELLDRLKYDDFYDGGASLASLGSVVSIRDTVSTTLIESPEVTDSPKEKSNLSVTSDNIALSVSVETSTIRMLELPTPDLLSSTPTVYKWEKVSSATTGDDDYVPIVDYTKEKRSNKLPIITNTKIKVSRLEAYREKARKRRKRRMIIVVIFAAMFTILWWAWSRKGSMSRKRGKAMIKGDDKDHNSTEYVRDDQVQNKTNDSRLSLDDALESKFVDACPWDMKARFSTFLDEIRCSQGGVEIVVLNDEIKSEGHMKGNDQNVVSPPNKTKEVQSTDAPRCKNPFVRLFSKKCRKLGREKKKMMEEDASQHEN